MQGSFTEKSLDQAYSLLPGGLSVNFSEHHDFTRCVRPNGTVYGSRGKCKKGVEEGKTSKGTASADEKMDSLPQGDLFPTAKRIDGIFKKSRHSWSEVIESLERNIENGKRTTVNIEDVKITQPNVLSSKVKKMVQGSGKTPTIDAVLFPDGEIVIHDGHHRLTANWALGNKTIEVNLVRAES